MKIKREIKGVMCEIELTDNELDDAFREKQHVFDIQDVEDVFNAFDDSEMKQCYGVTYEEAMDRKEEIAYRMRRNICKYDMGWQEARIEWG